MEWHILDQLLIAVFQEKSGIHFLVCNSFLKLALSLNKPLLFLLELLILPASFFPVSAS